MKKVIIIGLIVALALIFVGGAGVVYARVSGAETRTFIRLNAVQNGEEIVRQFGSGPEVVIGGDATCPLGPQTEFNGRVGPGGMMRGFGQGVIGGGNGYGPCSGANGYGVGPGGMMQGYGPGGMMQGYAPGGMMQGYGPGGMMGGYGARGMMQGRGALRGEGPLHEYMIAAFAEAVDLTVDEVETRLEDGENLKEIALAQGFTEDELPDLVTQVRQSALDAAVADGSITQEQADRMLDRMENYQGPGFGPGFGAGRESCPMLGGDEVEEQQP